MIHVPKSMQNMQLRDITNPHDADVLCGRGGAALRHPGNQIYRRLVDMNKGYYVTCLKAEKLKISKSIVATVREQRGRFLERGENGSTWYEIGDKKAVEKTSQALREGQPQLRQRIIDGMGAIDNQFSNGVYTPPAGLVNPAINPYALAAQTQQGILAQGQVAPAQPTNVQVMIAQQQRANELQNMMMAGANQMNQVQMMGNDVPLQVVTVNPNAVASATPMDMAQLQSMGHNNVAGAAPNMAQRVPQMNGMQVDASLQAGQAAQNLSGGMDVDMGMNNVVMNQGGLRQNTPNQFAQRLAGQTMPANSAAAAVNQTVPNQMQGFPGQQINAQAGALRQVPQGQPQHLQANSQAGQAASMQRLTNQQQMQQTAQANVGLAVPPQASQPNQSTSVAQQRPTQQLQGQTQTMLKSHEQPQQPSMAQPPTQQSAMSRPATGSAPAIPSAQNWPPQKKKAGLDRRSLFAKMKPKKIEPVKSAPVREQRNVGSDDGMPFVHMVGSARSVLSALSERSGDDLKDHLADMGDQGRRDVLSLGSKRSIFSGMSGISDASDKKSIFSDLSEVVGGASTRDIINSSSRSLALSEVSGIGDDLDEHFAGDNMALANATHMQVG